jgi:hypothetical protein
LKLLPTGNLDAKGRNDHFGVGRIESNPFESRNDERQSRNDYFGVGWSESMTFDGEWFARPARRNDYFGVGWSESKIESDRFKPSKAAILACWMS